jgi:predicted nucleic acid-binding protein
MSVDFFDSNVFIYLFDDSAPEKQSTAKRLVAEAVASGSGRISYQVVQETLNVVTRKLSPPVAPADALRLLDSVLMPLWRVAPSQALFHRGVAIQTRYQYRFYDATIVAAALEAGCERLLSEDLAEGQSIEGLTICNPFGAGREV